MSDITPHESVLDRVISLQLNASWMPVSRRSVRSAIVSMMSESHGEPPVLGLDIELDADGNVLYATPLAWAEWEKLPVRDGDLYVQTHKGRIRAPTVTIARFYHKVPMKKPRLSNGNIHERDGYTCQYTGEKLTRATASVDHVLPLSRGGRNTWGNMVSTSKKRNQEKGNRLNHEVGLTLLRAPQEPKAVPVMFTLNEAKHASWLPFISRN